MNILKTIADAINPPAPNTLQVFTAKFAETYGGEIVSAPSLKQIKAFEADWREALRDKNERYTSTAARNEFNKQMNSDKPAEPDGFKNLLSEYEARTQRAEFAMKKIDEDSIPLVKSILQDFIEAGEIWIAERVKSEKNEAAEFGVAFIPSQILLTAQRLIASHKIRIQNLSPYGRNPAAHLAFLKLD